MKTKLILLILCAVCLPAASVVATIDGAQPFQIRGNWVPVSGVSHWPVFSGDEIVTSAGSALLSFPDGSRVLVSSNARVILTRQAGQMRLKVTKGGFSYKLAGAASYSLETIQQGFRNLPGTEGSVLLDADNVTLSGDAGILAQIAVAPRVSQPAAIAVTYGSVPSGITVTPGPPPVSIIRQ